jgi:hypothetical protein
MDREVIVIRRLDHNTFRLCFCGKWNVINRGDKGFNYLEHYYPVFKCVACGLEEPFNEVRGSQV